MTPGKGSAKNKGTGASLTPNCMQVPCCNLYFMHSFQKRFFLGWVNFTQPGNRKNPLGKPCTCSQTGNKFLRLDSVLYRSLLASFRSSSHGTSALSYLFVFDSPPLRLNRPKSLVSKWAAVELHSILIICKSFLISLISDTVNIIPQCNQPRKYTILKQRSENMHTCLCIFSTMSCGMPQPATNPEGLGYMSLIR